MKFLRMVLAAALCLVTVATAWEPAQALPYGGRMRPYLPVRPDARAKTFVLSDGSTVTIARGGVATIRNKKRAVVAMRLLSPSLVPNAAPGSVEYADQLERLAQFVETPQKRNGYATDHIIVVFRDGTTAQDELRLPAQSLRSMRSTTSAAPRYTSDAQVNAAFTALGVSGMSRLFKALDRSKLSSLRYAAQSRTGKQLLNIANAYAVRITSASPLHAVEQLKKLPNVVYVSADWIVTTMNTGARALPYAERESMRSADVSALRQRSRIRTSSGTIRSDFNNAVPSNYGVISSGESMLDASGIDAMSAYEEIVDRFHQLPGTGEVITNVSLGDIFSTEDLAANQACYGHRPTVRSTGGQRYIDWPGMPLIPTYAADANGHIDPNYVSCGEGGLVEIGLDFSMMAPLPDDRQRPGEQAPSSIMDLLGVAPGASYRLVVPATNVPSGAGFAPGGLGSFLSTIDGVFLAAAMQNPRPDVITASLGAGVDWTGFPGRYLEDDPLAEAVIASIVNSMNVVVCISAGDGTRTFTPAAIGPSGGSVATDTTSDSTATTNMNDIAYTTAPSLDLDSGAIDVGSVTLNDIYSMAAESADFASHFAFPTTRFNGSQNFSSGFGSRVNISAPGDNLPMITKDGPGVDNVAAFLGGGTSASAPEVAAAAADVLQVARLTGHPFASARSVRDFLVQNASPVSQAAASDQAINVGPELNVRRAVEALLANAGTPVTPDVKRVAISQRRVVDATNSFDTTFFTNTNPGSINLRGLDYTGNGLDGSGLGDYITIAPDWQGMPSNAAFELSVMTAGHKVVLATTPFTRLLPTAILSAAGLPVPATMPRTVHLTYSVTSGFHHIAQTSFDLTFGSTDGTTEIAAPPIAPPVVTGDTLSVSYDLTKVRRVTNPTLVVSEPGRATPSWLAQFPFLLTYAQPLTNSSGAAAIPVSSLPGAGTYGVGILWTDSATGLQRLSDLALVRIEKGSSVRAPAPLLRLTGSYDPPVHSLQLPFNGSVTVAWDATNVPNATGALLEVSAPGPVAPWYTLNTFNNPNGSIPDNDGNNTGSVKVLQLPGIKGQTTFSGQQLGLRTTMLHTLRIIPMRGSVAAGEAGDVSSISMAGVAGTIPGLYNNADGVTNLGGFAVDPRNSNGYVISSAPIDAGIIFGQVTNFVDQIIRFDQNTGATSLYVYDTPAGPWGARGAGILNGRAFVGRAPSLGQDTPTQYFTVGPLESKAPPGTTYAPFALASPSQVILQASFNPLSDTMAALVFDGSTEQSGAPIPVQLTTLNVATGAMGSSFATPIVTGSQFAYGNADAPLLFGADMALNKAVAIRQAQYDDTGATPSYVDVYDLSSGTSVEYPSIAKGINGGSGLAIDESTHTAMFGSAADGGLILLNLQNGAQTETFMPNIAQLQAASPAWWVTLPTFFAADPVNHLFLAWAPLSQSILTNDYNATGELYVFSETGTLLKTITGWGPSVGPDAGDNAANYLQVNGTTRTAYLMMGDAQISAIAY